MLLHPDLELTDLGEFLRHQSLSWLQQALLSVLYMSTSLSWYGSKRHVLESVSSVPFTVLSNSPVGARCWVQPGGSSSLSCLDFVIAGLYVDFIPDIFVSPFVKESYSELKQL
jgi:hypothetical protein